MENNLSVENRKTPAWRYRAENVFRNLISMRLYYKYHSSSIRCAAIMPVLSLVHSSLDISVRNPVTHNTWDKGRYTSYEIAVNTSNKSFCLSSSTTRRRYSEFEWLRKTLKNHHPLVTPPELPPKKFFSDRFDFNFVTFRMKGLEDFLNSLLAEKVFLSDTTMHLFLQTNLSIKEIIDYIEGKISANSLDSLWKAKGVKENCREFCDLSPINKEEWTTLVKIDEKPHSENLIVPPHTEELRDSNNSDISSSFSDDDDQETESEYPYVSIVPKNARHTNFNADQDSGVSFEFEKPSQSKLDSQQRTTIKENSSMDKSVPIYTSEILDIDAQYDDENYIKEIELDASSITDVELEDVLNFTVTNEFSIN